MNNTKKAIFDSAIEVFSNRGYNSATMDEIAVNAGVAKGTLYYHFNSKEDIFKYIVKEGMDLIIQEIEEMTGIQENPLIKINLVCRRQLNLVNDNKDFIKVIMSQLWGQELRQIELRDSIENYILHIQKYIQEAMDVGLIKKGEASFMAYTLFGVICSTAVYELINKDNDLNKLVDNLIEYILKGIKA